MIRAPAGTPAWGIDIVKQINADATAAFHRPVHMPTFPKADLPDAALWKDCWIKVSDEANGDTAAESDGTHWRRMQDRAIVS